MKTTATATSKMFQMLVRQATGMDCVPEYRFHPSRKWRFDFAIPDALVAIEIDGGVWTGGRHVNPKGYLGDLDKFNAAAALGWRVLKFTPQNQYTSEAFRLIREAVECGGRRRIDAQ